MLCLYLLWMVAVLMFLIIEAIIRKPVPQKIEQPLTAFFFTLLMIFAIIVYFSRLLKDLFDFSQKYASISTFYQNP